MISSILRPLSLFAVCLLFAGWHTPNAPTLDRISFAARSDGQGYVVRLHTSGDVQFSRPRSDGDAVEIRLYRVRRAGDFRQDALKGPVTDVRVKPDGADLLLRFSLAPTHAVHPDAYHDAASSHVLLALNFVAPPPVRAATVSDQAQGPSSGNPFTSVAKPSGERWRLDTVVIDAGHGGKDPGAQANGYKEKDLALGVAKKLGSYLEERLGLNVVYTRTDDRFVELKDRGHIANKAGGKLFISLHLNAVGGRHARSVHGAEVYFLGLHRSDEAAEVMERENSVIRLESDPDAYKAFGGDFVLQTLAQSSFLRASEQLSMMVEDQFRSRVGRKSRGVKQAGFLVLVQASMPALLVELGFITHPDEARFLASDQGQDYMASALFRAVRDYKQQYEKGLNITAEKE